MTPDEVAVVARYELGESVIALAHRTGMTRKQIHWILAEAGVPRRPAWNIATLPDQIKACLVEMYRAGWTVTTISEQLGLEKSLVRDVVRLEGITIKRGRRPVSVQPRVFLPYVEPEEPEEPEEPALDATSEEARRLAERIVAAYQEGEEVEAISEKVGLARWRVAKVLANADIPLGARPTGVRWDEQKAAYQLVGEGSATEAGAPGAARWLTRRQLGVLKLLARGMTNRAIARELRFSESTIRQETMNIYATLGVANRRQAAQVAIVSKMV